MAVGPGSIAFTGFNADGSDNLAFVALEDLPNGTVIFFTDTTWDGAAFDTTDVESFWSWTATADVDAGTVIRIDNLGSGTLSTSNGTVDFLDETNTGLSNDNETIYAYVGTTFDAAPSAFLTAVSNIGFVTHGVLTGTALTEGTDALNLGGGLDIGAFNAPRFGEVAFTDYRAIINDPTNWLTQNSSGDQSADPAAPSAPFPTTAFTIGAGGDQEVGFAADSVTVSRIEADSGNLTITFTVERTGGTTGEVEFSGVVAMGTTNATDFGGAAPTAFSGVIADGETSGTFTVQVSGDTGAEDDETFTLTLDTVDNLGAPTTIGTADSSTVTILNDDAGQTIGGITIYAPAASLQGSASVPTATNALTLTRLGEFTGSGPDAEARAETVAFDPAGDRLYVSNGAVGAIDVASLSNTGATASVGSIDLTVLTDYGMVNSVAVKNGVLAVAYQNSDPMTGGYVALFDTADNSLEKLLQVGVLPDQLTFTPDGTKIVVSNEAEAVDDVQNAPGSVSIIDLSGGAASAMVRNTVSFSDLNGFETELADKGLAMFAGQDAGNDFEPEYTAVSPDGTRAYVGLQEVNAIAIIDLTDETADSPVSITPLGGIDRSLVGNQFDPTDEGDAITLGNFPIMSMPQPDAIATFTTGGFTYFVTANEGDTRVGDNLDTEVRLSNANLDPTAYPDAATLQQDEEAGRLNIIPNAGDTDGDGDVDQIYTQGGRGISIFRQNNDGSLTKVRETGGEFERIIAAQYPALHNTENGADPDNRSDNKGPEPEGVDVGQVGDRLYAFTILERVGGVMIYDVTNPASARYVGYTPATAQDYAPELVKFISAADSPTGAAMLLVANEVSGTTTVYRIEDHVSDDDDDDGDDGDGGNPPTNTPPTTGPDQLGGGSGPDTIAGGDGADTVTGGAGSDNVDGDAGNDVLSGGDGGDNLRGLNDSDSVDGGTGTDTVNGNMGSDTVSGGAGADFVYGGQDADSVDGGLGDDGHVNGNKGTDTVRGGDGSDTVYGGQGDDVVYGDAGVDRVSGDLGNDILFGGAQADQFVFARGGGADWAGDFNFTEGDRIQLSVGQTYTVRDYLGQVVIDLGGGDSIGLAGVPFASFSADWIVFS